jgi:hypothetical protein
MCQEPVVVGQFIPTALLRGAQQANWAIVERFEEFRVNAAK